MANEHTPNSTVNELADNILSAIFLTLVQEESLELESLNHHGSHTIEYPWILAAICQRWRMLCLDNSRLWSFFNLWTNHEQCDDDSGALMIEQTSLQLERSGNGPLFVQLAPRQHCKCDTQLARLDILLSQAPRWAVLTHEGTNGVKDIIPRLIPDGTRFPGLRALRLSLWDEHDDYRKLSLLAFAGIGLSWQNMTYLRIWYGGDDCETLMELLSQFRNLKSLHMSLVSSTRGTSTRALNAASNLKKTRIVFPRATEVSFTSSSLCKTHLAIDCIQIPAVQKLHLIDLKLRHESGSSVEHVAMDLVRRSRCSTSLQELSLKASGSFCDNTFTKLLKLCPNLRSFALSASRHDDATTVLQILAPSASAPPNTWLCPHLQVLSLEQLKIDSQALIDMVDARLQDKAGAKRLRSVLWIQPDFLPQDSKLFDDAKKFLKKKYDGSPLNLEISSSPDWS